MRKNIAESWEKVYDAFQQINFSAWDYNTIKQSIIEYIKIYRPEDFSDFIESSEFITLIETFAYIAELLAYRLDVNAHENFISTAKRKESIIRIARMLSYNPSRNLPARGLVKITSISTTEDLKDGKGNSLTNKTIRWNDINDRDWKDKFITIFNKVLSSEFGTVKSKDRRQIDGKIVEIYRFDNMQMDKGVIPFSVSVNGKSYNFEVVPANLDDKYGIVEKRPEKNQKISALYISDGNGDASDYTGFFFYIKQGTLYRTETRFDGATPNITYDVLVENVNETDVWVNNIDENTKEILTTPFDKEYRFGEWIQVDIANSQNILFNTNPYKNKYEIQTLDDDKFRVVFGDGGFANIPSGLFEIWYRVSANEDYTIPESSIQNLSISIPYVSESGKSETATFTFSLIYPLQNSAKSEDIEQIRRIAPSVYYTQDRMVNARDYNEFLLQDSSILKLRAVNRTFAGDSNYISWHDPKNNYDNVKIFGDDLVIYKEFVYNDIIINQSDLPIITSPDDYDSVVNTLIYNYIQPILSTVEFNKLSIFNGIPTSSTRKTFNDIEINQLYTNLFNLLLAYPGNFYVVFNPSLNAFMFQTSEPSDWFLKITRVVDKWTITYKTVKIVCHSDTVNFFVSNFSETVLDFDTYKTNYDKIVVLKANLDNSGSAIMSSDCSFRVFAPEKIQVDNFIGINKVNDLQLIIDDYNGDGAPDVGIFNQLVSNTNYVYFNRESTNSEWKYVKETPEVISKYNFDMANNIGLWKRVVGRDGLNFLWMHFTPRYHLVDPSPTNIIDIYLIQRGYYKDFKKWLNGEIDTKPKTPSSYQLKYDYAKLLDNKMISDTVILHPGKIKLIIGKNADKNLQGVIKVIKSKNASMSDTQIKYKIVDIVNEFFNISNWEFGESFYFSELSAYIHARLSPEIDSVTLVPTKPGVKFGNLMEIKAEPDEILMADINIDDIEFIESLNSDTLKI